MPDKSMKAIMDGVDQAWKDLVRDPTTGKLRDKSSAEYAVDEKKAAAHQTAIQNNLQKQRTLDQAVMTSEAFKKKWAN